MRQRHTRRRRLIARLVASRAGVRMPKKLGPVGFLCRRRRQNLFDSVSWKAGIRQRDPYMEAQMAVPSRKSRERTSERSSAKLEQRGARRSAQSSGGMKRLFTVAIGVFAVIGVLYTAFAIYVSWFVPRCQYYVSADARSPDGKYFATFQQTICEDPARSRSSVVMGGREPVERITRLEVIGTNDVQLTWSGNRELIVSLPSSASTKVFGPYEGWPRVTERRVPRE